jgi:hypothetical protein
MDVRPAVGCRSWSSMACFPGISNKYMMTMSSGRGHITVGSNSCEKMKPFKYWRCSLLKMLFIEKSEVYSRLNQRQEIRVIIQSKNICLFYLSLRIRKLKNIKLYDRIKCSIMISKVRGFKPGWGWWLFQDVKILSTSLPGL